MGISISAIIIAKNEELMIANCIHTLGFCQEVIVVDTGSSDNTVAIAKQCGAKVIVSTEGSFADWRNVGLQNVTQLWVLYVDADERVTPVLAGEIEQTLTQTSYAAFALDRQNIHFGKWMRHGGWQNDTVVRIFSREKLKTWEGRVHEHAIVDGNTGKLKNPLVHCTHRTIRDGLIKSYTWTDIEASLLLHAKVPCPTTWTLCRKFAGEFIRRFFIQKGYMDGIEGFIEAFQQAMNRFFVYERLWELSSSPKITDRYERIEKEIDSLWTKAK